MGYRVRSDRCPVLGYDYARELARTERDRVDGLINVFVRVDHGGNCTEEFLRHWGQRSACFCALNLRWHRIARFIELSGAFVQVKRPIGPIGEAKGEGHIGGNLLPEVAGSEPQQNSPCRICPWKVRAFLQVARESPDHLEE